MTDKYKGKYRIPPTRAQWWDYSKVGAYFITICTANRYPYFGCIADDVMTLSPTGKIAERYWYEIVNHAKNMVLGEFVVMPNHVHGIVIIDESGCADTVDNAFVETRHALSLHNTAGSELVETRHALSLSGEPGSANAETRHALSLHEPCGPLPGQSRFRNPGKNTISSIIGGYKSAVSKQCNLSSLDFAWQSRFHDHIICDREEYDHIAWYITNNPANWKKDKFYIDL